MKKYIVISALALAAAGMTSCDDFLNDNRYPLDKQTDNPTYWNNEANVQKQCDNLYANFPGYTTGYFYFDTFSDNNASGYGTNFNNWKYTTIPTSSSNWSSPYTVIRQCNYIINNTATSTLNETAKAKFMGIGRLIRAQQYYWLVRVYGDVQYTDQVLDLNDTEVLFSPREDRDLVMDKVYEDLDYAAKNIGSGSATTYSSDLAYAMMAEICLYEGTYCKYRTMADNYKAADPGRATKYLEYAANAAKVLMDKNYTLNSTYIGNYNSIDLSKNPEMIFYKRYLQSTLTHSQINYITRTTAIASMSKDAFDAYLFKDGKPLCCTSENTDDAGYIKKGIVDGILADGTASEGDMLYIGDLLKVRDQRLYQTIDTCVSYGTTPTSKNPRAGITWARYGSDRLTSTAGYLTRKFDNPEEIPWDYRAQSNYTHSPQYWLGYVYCMYAEAKAELGTLNDTDLDMSLNKLWARAGLPAQKVNELKAISDPENKWNVDNLVWEVRRCRRCELMFDKDIRYWDLQRWHMLDKLDTKKFPNICLGANIKNGRAIADFPYTSGDYIRATPSNERVYDNRQYLAPIPTYQIDYTFGAITQNPLWASQN